MNRHTLRYIDLHPQPVKPRRTRPDSQWPWAIGCVIIFAAIGIMLAWRG